MHNKATLDCLPLAPLAALEIRTTASIFVFALISFCLALSLALEGESASESMSVSAGVLKLRGLMLDVVVVLYAAAFVSVLCFVLCSEPSERSRGSPSDKDE
jgi:hypothetical protein